MHCLVVLGPVGRPGFGDPMGIFNQVWNWCGLPLRRTQPPNGIITGNIVGTAFAIITGVKPDVAVGVVTSAVAVQTGITFPVLRIW